MNQLTQLGRSSAAMLSRRLSDNAEAVCRHYLSSGKKNGSFWMVGDVQNNPGASLHVRLHATDHRQAGKWTDEATGEHGDLLDIIRFAMGFHTLADVLKEARIFLSEPAQTARPTRAPVPSNSRPAARRLFAASKPIVGTLGEVYLRHRAITAPLTLPALRFHPTCYHRALDGEDRSQWPAIIAAVTTPQGELTGLHRTWLARDGLDKAPLENPRRAMGDILGASIQLGAGADIPSRFPTLTIHAEDFPEEEQVQILHAVALAGVLDRLAYSISAAIGLVEYCEAGLGAPEEWRAIAARDAAMNAYHFCRAIEYLGKLKAPSLRARLDSNAIREARRIARARLPDFVSIRHAVGHTVDLMFDPDEFRLHAVDGEHYIFGGFSNRTLTVTKDGKHFAFVIDVSLREATRRAADIVMDAFMGVEIIRPPVAA